MLIFNNGLII